MGKQYSLISIRKYIYRPNAENFNQLHFRTLFSGYAVRPEEGAHQLGAISNNIRKGKCVCFLKNAPFSRVIVTCDREMKRMRRKDLERQVEACSKDCGEVDSLTCRRCF